MTERIKVRDVTTWTWVTWIYLIGGGALGGTVSSLVMLWIKS